MRFSCYKGVSVSVRFSCYRGGGGGGVSVLEIFMLEGSVYQ